MATFRNVGTIGKFEDKMIGNMIARGYAPEFAKNCFEQIKGFGSYGFPESHAASFAQLVYVSSWLKHYHPDAFCCGLLNSQPMGFYAPAQIVGDARKNGVEVREIDVSFSFAQNTLEEGSGKYCAVRLGFRQIDGFSWVDADEERLKRFRRRSGVVRQSLHGDALPLPLAGEGWGGGVAASHTARVERVPHPDRIFDAIAIAPEAGEVETDWADRIVAARTRRPFTSLEDFARDTGLPKRALILLADADAFRSIGLDRRAALWAVRRLPDDVPLPLFEAAIAREQPDENAKPLPLMPLPEQVVADYQTIRLSLKGHPMEFLRRDVCAAKRVVACEDVNHDQRQAPCPLRRRGAGAAASGQRQGRRLHDAGGRNRHRQYRGVAEGDGAVPQGGDGRAAHPGRGLYPEQPGRGRRIWWPQRLFDRSHDLIGLANDALSRKHAVPAGPALIEPLQRRPPRASG